jgi:hypothetical protein
MSLYGTKPGKAYGAGKCTAINEPALSGSESPEVGSSRMDPSAEAVDKSGPFYVDDQTLGGTERDFPTDQFVAIQIG